MDIETQERVNRIELAAGQTLLWLRLNHAPETVINNLCAALQKDTSESSMNAWWLNNGDDMIPFMGDLDDGFLWNTCEGPFASFESAIERRTELLALRAHLEAQ